MSGWRQKALKIDQEIIEAREELFRLKLRLAEKIRKRREIVALYMADQYKRRAKDGNVDPKQVVEPCRDHGESGQ